MEAAGGRGERVLARSHGRGRFGRAPFCHQNERWCSPGIRLIKMGVAFLRRISAVRLLPVSMQIRRLAGRFAVEFRH